MRRFLSSAFVLLYFIVVMFWVIILLAIVPFMIMGDIGTVLESGFSASSPAAYIAIFGFFIGISLLVSPLRRMYYKLPWLFPYVKILFINAIIFCVALMILNFGYRVQNETRHTVFFIIMLCEIVIGRVMMSFYFSRKKVQYVGGTANE